MNIKLIKVIESSLDEYIICIHTVVSTVKFINYKYLIYFIKKPPTTSICIFRLFTR